ncbi:uncharacterized protein LOC142651752 isoform X2 [Rhinoderma darwinii]|uniref:uncharacterized protein LOC142651752 isoform X2 n=1 Tax=Rhinoderma darwinii TaxID=43563 RepID=UPI003F67D62D
MAEHAPLANMEKSVEQFLRSVRTGQICNVTVFDSATFEIHLNGRKHRMTAPFSKSSEGIEYIHRYEKPGDVVVIYCELCGVQVLDVVNHLKSSSHIFAFLKFNHPKVYENVQLRGLHSLSETELKKIAVKEKYLGEFQQYVNSDNPLLMERIFSDKKIRRDEEGEPPRKILRMDGPPCNDLSATISGHMREKNIGVDQNEKKSTSDKRIQSDCPEYKECETGSNLKPNGFRSPYKITCNKDFYDFLQSFQISDETDEIFIQQIVKKCKSQLQEFYENTKQEKTTSDLNDDKNQEKGKLTIAGPLESLLQQADSTTTSNAKESTISKSTEDIGDHCEDSARHSVLLYQSSDMTCHSTKKPVIRPSVLTSVLKSHCQSIASIKKEPDVAVEELQPVCTSQLKSLTNADIFSGNTKEAMTTGQSQLPSEASLRCLALSVNKEPESVFSPPIPILNPNFDQSILKKTTKPLSASSPLCSRESSERKKNFFAFSVQNTPLGLPDIACQDQLPVKSSVTPLSIKKEPVLSYTDITSTSRPKVANATLVTLSHSDINTSDISPTSSSHHSCSIQSTAELYSSFREVPRMVATNVQSVQDRFYTSQENSDFSPSVEEQAIASSVCIFPTNYNKPSPEPSLKLSRPDKLKPCTVFDELHVSIAGSSVTSEKPRISHLNCPPSPLNTYDAYRITFGGKKNMHISEVIAEVVKFAETKPVLKGMDINQVVRILIQNRIEKYRKGSHNITP